MLVTRGEGHINLKPVVAQRYMNLDEFYKLNPNCCKLVPHNTGDRGPYVGLGDRMFGDAAKIVSVTYTVNYVDEGGRSGRATADAQYAVSNCGRAWSARH